MNQLTTKFKVNTFINFLSGLWTFTSKYLVWLLLFVSPIHQFLITIYVLLFIDLITGIYSKVFIKKEAFSSKRLRDTILKFIGYSVAVFISYMFDFTLLDKLLIVSKLVAGYIIFTEFQSGMENLSIICGIDLWVMIKDKVTDIFNSKLKDLDKKNKEDNSNDKL